MTHSHPRRRAFPKVRYIRPRELAHIGISYSILLLIYIIPEKYSDHGMTYNHSMDPPVHEVTKSDTSQKIYDINDG